MSLLALALPTGVLAEELPLDSTAIRLDAVMVSAKRWGQYATHLPHRISTITPRETELAQPQTTADLLAASGQVFVQKSQLGGGSPMIRGFATNRLLYVVDGVRMNTAIFRSGNIQNVISLDPYALERTEVLMGAHSTIYGSDAIGGVMSFTTLSPRFSDTEGIKLTGSLASRYSSASDERTGHAHLGVGGARWASMTSVSSFGFGDLRQGSHGPSEYLKPYIVDRVDGKDVVRDNPDPLRQSPSGYNQLNLMQKLAFRPSDAWTLEYALHYSRTSSYARYDRHTRLRKGVPRYGEWDYGPQLWVMNHLTASHRSGGVLYDRMEVRGAIQRFEESRIDRALGKDIRTTQVEVVDAYSVNADFTKGFAHGLNLFYGAEWVHNHVRSTGEELNIVTSEHAPTASRYPQSHWQTLAVYADGSYDLSSRLTLDGGVRYTHFALDADFANHGFTLPYDPKVSSRSGSFSGSAGLTYRPLDNWLLTLNLSRGFRYPNVDDMGKLFDSVDGAVVVPNPALRPEYAHGIELGLGAYQGTWLQADLATYYTHLSGALVRRPFTYGGASEIEYRGEMSRVLAMQNAASAEVYGIQASARVRLPLGFSLSAQANIQHGTEELEDGSRSTLRHASPFFGRARLSYQWHRLRAELSSTFQATRHHSDMPEEEKTKREIYALDTDGNAYAPGWVCYDLRASYEFPHRIRLTLALENLTDLRYRTYSSGISAPGRNLVIAASWHF